MNIEELRRAIDDACRELTFAPAYLHALADTSEIVSTAHYDRLRCVADVVADLTETAVQASAMLAAEGRHHMLMQIDELREWYTAALNTIDELKAQLAEKDAQITADNNEIVDLRKKVKLGAQRPGQVWLLRNSGTYAVWGVFYDRADAEAAREAEERAFGAGLFIQMHAVI